MELGWSAPQKTSHSEAGGNFLGFTLANEHLVRALGRHAKITPDARAVVYWGSPFISESPQRGKFNVFFTMYENRSLPQAAVEKIDKYDLIVVPSHWCKEAFRRYTKKPIEVCPLGVDPRSFPYKRRRRKAGERFRFLYVGAPNPRKYTILPDLYRALLGRLPDAELYLKTTGGNLSPSSKLVASGMAQREGEVVRGDDWIVDNRHLSPEGLLDIYYSAHAFLFLTCGEGFGLTGLEAMATGLPLIVSNWSGVTEYANSRNSVLVKCDYGDHADKFARLGLGSEKTLISEPYAYHVGWPDLNSATTAAHMVYSNYDFALKKARRARETAAGFTWDSAARRLCAILKKYGIV